MSAHGGSLLRRVPAHGDAVGDRAAGAVGALERGRVELRREPVDPWGEPDRTDQQVARHRRLEDARGGGQVARAPTWWTFTWSRCP